MPTIGYIQNQADNIGYAMPVNLCNAAESAGKAVKVRVVAKCNCVCEADKASALRPEICVPEQGSTQQEHGQVSEVNVVALMLHA